MEPDPPKLPASKRGTLKFIVIKFRKQEVEGLSCRLPEKLPTPGACCDPVLTALHLFHFLYFFRAIEGGRGRERHNGVAW